MRAALPKITEPSDDPRVALSPAEYAATPAIHLAEATPRDAEDIYLVTQAVGRGLSPC